MTEKRIHRFTYEAMSTTFETIFFHEEADYVRHASQAVFAEITRLEGLLSKFMPGSIISQINRLKPGESVSISHEVHECLTLAAEAYLATEGAFDIAFESRAQCGVSAMEFLLLSDPDDPDAAHAMTYMAGIAPEAAEHNFAGACLNLGGIGKGYALDKCAELLTDWDLTNYVLNSGTSTVLAKGAGPEGKGWPIGIAGDYAHLVGMDLVYLHDAALSGSGTAVKGEHIQNPATATPAHDHICAWARHPNAALSDAFSTAFMILDPKACLSLCRNVSNLNGLGIIRDENGIEQCWKTGF